MSSLDTKFFGAVDFDPGSVVHFPAGLPGFETAQEFVLMNRPGSEPVIFLQSVQTSDLCFITLPVLAVDQQYSLAVMPDDLELIGFSPLSRPEIGRDILCLAILTLASGEIPTANLLSPIAVNLKNRTGVQIIQPDASYSHRHPLIGASPCS